MSKSRSPSIKLAIAAMLGLVLIVPLMMIYALVWDRQSQSETAQVSIASGWGGPQVIVGPVLVVPYDAETVETVTENGKEVRRAVKVVKELYLSPTTNTLTTNIKPEQRKKSIYQSVLFEASNTGTAKFELPKDFDRYGIARTALRLASAELRFGVSDSRGLQANSKVTVNGTTLQLQPGKGLNASGNSGFYTFIDWNGTAALDVSYTFGIRGNKSLTMVPRGGETSWSVKSSWPNPSFSGDFLPNEREVKDSGFSSKHNVTNLALGQALVLTEDPSPPAQESEDRYALSSVASVDESGGRASVSQAASIGLIEPVDLYSQVDRSIKYGFLFIGFTFLAFLMFDVIGGARVAPAEYLLTGVALVLFFVLLLAFSEVIGFMGAYLIAAGAITGLLTAYSGAILKSWTRAKIIAGLLAALYATLYVLLNLEAYSLVIGSVLLFVALAVVMWATRAIDWNKSGDEEREGSEIANPPAPSPAPASARETRARGVAKVTE